MSVHAHCRRRLTCVTAVLKSSGIWPLLLIRLVMTEIPRLKSEVKIMAS